MIGPEPGGQPQQGTQAGQAMPAGQGPNGQPQGFQLHPDTIEQNRLTELAALRKENQDLRSQIAGPFPFEVEQAVRARMALLSYDRMARQRLDAESRQPIALIPGQEMRQRQPPPFLVEGLIPDRSIGVIFGETGAYKSFLVLNLLLCSGSGADFLGHAVYGTGWGVYVMGEGQHDAGLRLDAAIGAHLGFTHERLAYIEQPFPLSDDAAVDEVIGRCRELGAPVRLMAFDSFADFYGAGDNENSSTDMQRLIAGMKRISAAVGCVVMACAHTGHGGTDEDGGDRPPPPRLRGSSRFRQAWDFELMATGRALVPTKNRYGPLAAPVPYRTEAAGGSLVVARPELGAAAAAHDGGEEQEWPYPVSVDKLDKVVAAVCQTPGLSMSVVAKAAKVRKDDTAIALIKAAEMGLVRNAGTENRPKWVPGPMDEWSEQIRDWLAAQPDAPATD